MQKSTVAAAQGTNILVVEDDFYLRADIKKRLSSYGKVFEADSLAPALKMLRSNTFDYAFVDLSLSADAEEKEGIVVIDEASKQGVIPFALTSHGDETTIGSVYNAGAKHFFQKKDFLKEPEKYLSSYLREDTKRTELSRFFREEFITQDRELIGKIELLQHQNLGRDQRILLVGPTGVGKSKLAELIHRISEPENDNFQHLNLSEFNENLFESQIFGHKKGSFSGADKDFEGYFKRADKGTLFLDEIGTLPLTLQKKLLKFLDTKKYSALGSTKTEKSDHRLITATCDDLGSLIQEKKFREDFYFRIRGIEIYIPPLRERRADIPLLIQHFQNKNARKIHITDEAKNALCQYDWFGNVRELRDVIENLINNGSGKVRVSDLPENIIRNHNPYQKSESTSLLNQKMQKHIMKHGLQSLLDQISIEAMQFALKETEHKKTKAGDLLRIGFSKRDRLLKAMNEVKRNE